MHKLGRRFFARRPVIVARELLGKLLVRRVGNNFYVGKIVETEAYLGPGDSASHSFKGKTKRNEVMFGRAGIAYIYFTYGMHWLLNIITEKKGQPSGVLIRAVEPLSEEGKMGSGPAKLTRWMEIDGDINREDVTSSGKLFIANKFGDYLSEKVPPSRIVAKPRVGIDYAGEHKDLPLRFYIKDSDFISRR